MKKAKKIKRVPLSKLKRLADNCFSHYIRQRDNHICFTCGAKLLPNKSQNGHFISRASLNTRYNEDNCHCQCYACNIARQGNYIEYYPKMLDMYGLRGINALKKMSKVVLTSSQARALYESVIEKYKKYCDKKLVDKEYGDYLDRKSNGNYTFKEEVAKEYDNYKDVMDDFLDKI